LLDFIDLICEALFVMRLKTEEVLAIKNTFAEYDANALVYLFGSRTDDSKKGGDIDLLVLSQTITPRLKREIKIKLFDKIGEQKIDILLAKNEDLPFVRIAKQQGVLL
jgi:uncharacterized protein